ncbi:MAG: ABC transporter substrate-binding protein [Acidobacteria bacterium]|nr:ABC transporter substrate-binding protein [Acidobacteriota bacterium]
MKISCFSARGLPKPLLLACLLASGLSACQPPGRQGKPSGRVVWDQLSRRVVVPTYPKRIVSMAPSVTEILFALGVWDRVVGITLYDAYPADSGSRTRIGDMLRPNLEVVLSLKPDLVVATVNGNYRESVERLESFGIPVFILGAARMEEIFRSVELLGDAVGERPRAGAVVEEMRRRISLLQARLAGQPRKAVLYLTWVDPVMVPGRDAFETDALALAKLDSLTRDLFEQYSRFSMEQVIRLKPDTILTVDHNAAEIRKILSSPQWAMLPAVKKARVYLVSDLIQHPSQRVVEGVEEVARKLHPEAFEQERMPGAPDLQLE